MQTVINLKTPEFLSQGLIFFMCLHTDTGLPGWLSGKEPAASAGDAVAVSWLWVGKVPWGRRWHPTPVLLPAYIKDRGAWWATVHGVKKRCD